MFNFFNKKETGSQFEGIMLQDIPTKFSNISGKNGNMLIFKQPDFVIAQMEKKSGKQIGLHPYIDTVWINEEEDQEFLADLVDDIDATPVDRVIVVNDKFVGGKIFKKITNKEQKLLIEAENFAARYWDEFATKEAIRMYEYMMLCSKYPKWLIDHCCKKRDQCLKSQAHKFGKQIKRIRKNGNWTSEAEFQDAVVNNHIRWKMPQMDYEKLSKHRGPGNGNTTQKKDGPIHVNVHPETEKAAAAAAGAP